MRILYICTGNSFRSPVAEALTRKFRPRLEVESAGTDAVEQIAENAEEMLERDNAERFVKPEPDQLSERAVAEADVVVCMTDRHYVYLQENFSVDSETRIWRIEDPVHPGVEPEEAYRGIKAKVKML
ncbi:MAG: low molecular weight phosphatase family protein [Candidatus Nanohaloarchaea archaeon]